MLLECGINRFTTDVHGSTLLHLAAADGLALVVRHLLNIGLVPDVKDNHGWTPLLYAHVATEVGNVPDDCLVALLEKKPDQLHHLAAKQRDKQSQKVVASLITSLATKPMAYKYLNDLIRRNPSLLTTSLSWVRDIPGLLDFSNKRTVFLTECRAFDDPTFLSQSFEVQRFFLPFPLSGLTPNAPSTCFGQPEHHLLHRSFLITIPWNVVG
ncbi:hypothetical protein BC829DRAFT_264312 [Chytridium lagenaria]|nr:hypothetical protein BC829DRAFT_264312 [Chytridium lagenaria]